MPNAVLLSQARGAGWLYVTPDTLPNPWDTLPPASYWPTELAYVRPLGECPTPVVRANLVIGNVDAPVGDDRLAFSGQVTLPEAPALDPVAKGVRLVLADTTRTVLDVALPGGLYVDPPGQGWSVNRSGTTWTYRNRAPLPLAGITKVVLGSRPSSPPGLVKFRVKGGGGAYPVSIAALPLSAALLLDPTDPTGPCARATFPGPAPTCRASANGRTVRCR